MSFFGINLAPLGKKLQEYEGDVGRFFGGAPAQAPAPAPTMPQRQAAANIGAAAGFGPAPAPMQIPTIAPPPPPPKPKVSIAQRQAAANIATVAGIGPSAKVAMATPQAVTQADPLHQAGAVIGALEANNPYLHQGPAPKNKAEMYAQMRDPNNPATKFALMLAQSGGDSGGAGKSAGATGPKGLPAPKGGEKPNVAQSPKVKLVDTAAGKITPAPKDWPTEGLPEDMPPVTSKQKGNPETFANSKANQTTHQIELGAQNEKASIAEAQTHSGNVHEAINNEIPEVNKLSKSDQAKFREAANGVDVGKVDDPAQFQKALEAHWNAMDHSLAAQRAAGADTKRWNNGKFSPLYLKASHEAMDNLGIPEDQRFDLGDGKTGFTQEPGSSDYNGYHNIDRKYASYADADAKSKGILQPLNASHIEDMQMYGKGVGSRLESALLAKNLERLYPGEISTNRNVTFKDGQRLVPAAKGELPFNVSPRLNKFLANYKSSKLDNSVGEGALKTAEVTGKAARKVAFLAAPIHYVNLTTNYAGRELGSAHLIKMFTDPIRAVGAAVSPKLYRGMQQAAENDVKNGVSLRDYAKLNSIVENHPGTDYVQKGVGARAKYSNASTASHITPQGSLHAMGRFTNVLGWKLAKAMRDGMGLESGSPRALAVGAEMNKVLDTLNGKVEGFNPMGERLGSSGSIAPHWIRANVGLVKDAVIKWGGGDKGGAGNIARQTVLGKRALEATAAIIASAVATGQMPNFQQVINEAGFNPNNPIPNMQLGGTNPDGKPVVTNMPTDMIGLTTQLLTDPGHFLTARETPLLSQATQAYNNKDWAGNQIVDRSQPGWQVKQAEAAVKGLQPFGAQSVEKANGSKPTITGVQAAGEMFGFRTHRDPNDPQYQSALAYVKGMAKAVNGASEPDAKTINQYMSRQIDSASGNKISNGVVGGRDNAILLLGNEEHGGQALQRVYDAEHGLKNGDPLWQLPLTAPAGQPSVHSYLENQQQVEGMEKIGDKMGRQGVQATLDRNGWMDKLATARSDYYNSLPKSSTVSVKKEPDYPAADAQTTADLSTYNKIPSDQQATFLKAHPNVTDFFAASADWTNKIRVLENQRPEPTNAKATPEVQSILDTYNSLPKSKSAGNTGANSGARSAWIKANPNAYAKMTGFLAQTSMNSLIKNVVESQYAGQTTQAALKDIKNVGTYDITKSATLDANGNPTYGLIGTPGAGAANTTSAGASGGGGSSHKYYTKMKKFKSYAKGGGKGKVKLVHDKDTPKVAVAGKTKSGKPKVSIKPSLV